MTYTENPELDAASHDDELEAADELHETAKREAPGILEKQFAKLTKPADWFDKYTFAGGMSADELLYQAMEASDDATTTAFSELMMSDAAKPLRDAIANHFAKLHAFAIYTDWLEEMK